MSIFLFGAFFSRSETTSSLYLSGTVLLAPKAFSHVESFVRFSVPTTSKSWSSAPAPERSSPSGESARTGMPL